MTKHANPKIRKPEIAEQICRLIADGFTLRQIARELDVSHNAIVQWRLDDANFASQYARAKEQQADHFAEEILAIADEGSNDWMEREGITLPDHEHINRSRLRVDARKWLMAKMAPKKYGEKLEVEHGATPAFASALSAARERRLRMIEELPEPYVEHEPNAAD